MVIEFDTAVLERLRADARADQRSVGFLVRQIVGLYYAEIDDPANQHLNPLPGRPYISGKESPRINLLRTNMPKAAKTAAPYEGASGPDASSASEAPESKSEEKK